MKIRVTIMAENDKPRPEELTKDIVVAAWQVMLSVMCLGSNDRVTVENAEFIEDGDGDA